MTYTMRILYIWLIKRNYHVLKWVRHLHVICPKAAFLLGRDFLSTKQCLKCAKTIQNFQRSTFQMLNFWRISVPFKSPNTQCLIESVSLVSSVSVWYNEHLAGLLYLWNLNVWIPFISMLAHWLYNMFNYIEEIQS